MKTTIALIILVSLSTLALAQHNGWRYERLRPSGDIIENRYSPIGLSREKGLPMPLAEGSWDTVFNKPNYDKLLDNGYVFAMASDGDKLYIGGGFEYFNGIQCFNIIQYDRSTDQWSPIGEGFDAAVTALAVHNGKLYAGGYFTKGGFNSTASMLHLAEWNGAQWNQVGAGTNGHVRALAVIDTDLYVGGNFNKVGTMFATNIARWDGSNWHEVDGGLPDAVNCFLVDGDSLYVGGFFNDDARDLHVVALLSDGTWNSLNGGIGGEVLSLALFNGKLWAGGDIFAPISDPLIGLADWDGSVWRISSIDTTIAFQGGIVWSLHASANLLYIGGSFSHVAGTPASGVAVYTMSGEFLPLGGGNIYGRVHVMAPFDNSVYVGGNFLRAGPVDAGHLAKLVHADVWSSVGPLAEAQGGYTETWVNDIATAGRYVVIAGSFTTLDSKPVNNIAMWDKETRTWSALGDGLDGEVWGVTVYDNKVYVGGEFNHAGNSPARHIAYWDMTTQTWHAMGAGSPRFVDDIAVDETGSYASVMFNYEDGVGTSNHLGRWTGSSWEQVDGPIRGYVNTIAKSGDSLCIGGLLDRVDGNAMSMIALRTSIGWQALGDGLSDRVADILFANGEIYAGGWFVHSGSKQLGGIGRWDGSTWNRLGGMNDAVRSLAWRNGELFAAGNFTLAGTVTARFIASWDGKVWSDVEDGADFIVSAVAADEASLYVGGHFVRVGTVYFSYRFGMLNFEQGSVADGHNMPLLLGNYPNPASGQTTIGYSLTGDGFASIDLYTPAGIHLKNILSSWQSGGEHLVKMDLSDLPSGSYFYRLSSGGEETTKRLLIAR